MQEAITVLEKAEAVLMKRIRAMKDGSPKWSAANRLTEIRSALRLIKQYEKAVTISDDEYIKEALMAHPPIAQA